MRRSLHVAVATLFFLPQVLLLQACAAETGDTHPFLQFVRSQAANLRAADKPPATLADWQKQRDALRQHMQAAWCEFPATPCPLQPRILGTLEREGYRLEKIIFQTRPGIWMTANAYVPDRHGKLPAVLVVHGHWPFAKQDPVVQSRCLGLAKLGFFVLAVDAFGAGERGLGKALGEYHGEMVAATLLPVGLPLSGLQVYENMRAVDYLLTRDEVDGTRLGITGASGGGNQTMYAGTWDDRFAAAVPVCSVGNYQAYLGAACCLCEVVPGALRFTEEWGVLGLCAPRGLMVVNATKDARQFSVAEASKSIAAVQPVFELYGKRGCLRHATFESVHAYNQPMREAMYGWMTHFLKRTGDGLPIAEPEIKTEDPEMIRCFPGQSRPDDFATIPRFAVAEARKVLSRHAAPASADQWHAQRQTMLQGLTKCLFGGELPPVAVHKPAAVTTDADSRTIAFDSEPGITLSARQETTLAQGNKLAVLLDLEGAEKAAKSGLAAELRSKGFGLVTLDLRATGKLAYPRDKAHRAPDHNTAEWSLWIGRPLLGQWVVDVRGLLDALTAVDGKLPGEVLVAGVGPAGLVAVCAAIFDQRITRVAAIGSLASYVSDLPYEGQRLGIMVPGILRDAGDIPHLAALIAPRPLVVAGAVTGGGEPLSADELAAAFAPTRQVYAHEKAEAVFSILPTADAADIVGKQSNDKIPVILDTDIGDDIDDTWALAMLLRSPQLDLKLVTTTFGKAEYRAKLIAKLLTVAGRTDVPVGLGAGGRTGEGKQTAWVKDYDLKSYAGKVHDDGVQAMIDTISASPQPIRIISIGPSSTVAAALERQPQIAARAIFVGMQGSVRKGYKGGPVSAEYNVKVNIPAAKKALLVPWKQAIITPLDTCGLVQLTGERFKQLCGSDDPLVKAVLENYRIWAGKTTVQQLQGSSVLFDTVAVYLAYPGPKPLLTLEELTIGMTDQGFTPIDPAGVKMSVATSWTNLDGYYDLLVNTLLADSAR